MTGIGIFSVWFPSPSGSFTNIIQAECCLEMGACIGLYLFREPVKMNMKVCVHRRKRSLCEVSIHVSVLCHSFIINGAM